MRFSSRKVAFKNTKNRIISLTTAAVLAVASLSGAAPLFLSSSASAATSAVTPLQTQGWSGIDDNGNGGSFTYVNGPSGAGSTGDGSAQLSVNASNQGYLLAKSAYGGTALSSLTTLSYDTYVQQGNDTIAPTMQLNVAGDVTNPSLTWQGRLVFEPYMNSSVTDGQWQHWDAAAGKWWLSQSASKFAGNCGQGSPCTFAELTALYPNMGINSGVYAGVGFKAGSSWNVPFVGNVDNFSILGDNYDFENPTPTTVYVGYAADSSHVNGYNNFSTIQSAIDATTEDGTVLVAAGTYDGFSVVNKNGLTITGAGVGSTVIAPTTLVDTNTGHKYTADMQVSVFVNDSADITLSGMTVNDNGSAPGMGGPDALVFWNASSGTLQNSNVTGAYSINGIQTGQGIAVDGGYTDLTVNGVNISGFQKNGIDIVTGNSGTTSGSNVTVTVTGGSITGAGLTSVIAQNGILVWDQDGGSANLSVNGTIVKDFLFDGSSAAASGVLVYGDAWVDELTHVQFTNSDYFVSNNTGDTVFANNNWWGRVLGPDSSQLDGDVSVNSWCGNADCSTTFTKSGGAVEIPADTPIDLSDLLDNGSATFPDLTDVVINGTNVEVFIPAGTTVTAVGAGTWNGVLNQPQATTANVPGQSGKTITVKNAFKVGSDNFDLTFDAPVRLAFLGQTGSDLHVGFTGHDGVFHEITTVCDPNMTLADQFATGIQECKYDNGTDLIVWTKHFTTFATYTATAVPATTSSSSTGSTTKAAAVTRTAVTTPASASETAASILGAVAGIAALKDKAASTTTPKTAEASSSFNWWWLVALAAVAIVGAYLFAARRADKS